MSTGRHPRLPSAPPEDRAPDTLDEVRPVQVFAEGSDGTLDATDTERAAADRAYYDADPSPPRFADLEGRVTALEHVARRKSLWRTWGERIISFLAGSSLVAGAWVLAKADANGDARATAREREATFRWLVETVRTLDRRDALQQGQIDGLIDRLRYPLQGPPVAPTRNEP